MTDERDVSLCTEGVDSEQAIVHVRFKTDDGMTIWGVLAYVIKTWEGREIQGDSVA